MALKIIFMGTPGFSVSILKTIYNSEHKILQVYTQPPKKKIVVKKKTSRLFMIFVKQTT